MMDTYKKWSVVALLILSSASVQSANTVVDARGNGMGNTGVTTADYLIAPFYNPALVAVYRDRDTFGVLFPAISATARDPDKSLETIDDLQDSIKTFENTSNPNQSNVTQLNSYLDQLADDKPLAVSAGAGMAVAVPLDVLSLNIFARGYAEVISRSDIAANGGDSIAAVENRYQNSTVDLIAFGYSEFGVAMAKMYILAGQQLSFGITPKIQQLRTYKQTVSVKDFDLSDYDKSETNDNAFNLDFGAIWLIDNFRIGVAVKDLFAQELKTIDGISAYQLDTQVTFSGGYVTELFSAAIDIDATKQERFKNLKDDTQYLRFGVEGNAWGWVQLRAGYEMDLEDTLDDAFTFGIGISPGDLVSFDLAGNYAGDNQFGVSGNLAFTF
ncbi:Conjugal transfer protein TraF [Vibrio aestuarianus]|uniref:Conjugal transfer protein TraF n=2 Tax=Vibrio aestuarianus TaxID=28171 RepID=A0ABM9FJM7_9VIBR|nr:Conjugal transfer protein TraF [Vibrio aestuarianus]CAH8222923.1 Conjugal transfer protein TraF [Vibrio aestuarianus]CAH8227627.1 Conjugal transfer protein TraF [Vibrio aestuarianus]CAH8227637.1 Conjugal transfer protein TraF [Vibrio aestuarianus]CAH8227685.1 Conjugal transfer protein TraF [Vibrio aestuarianus]